MIAVPPPTVSCVWILKSGAKWRAEEIKYCFLPAHFSLAVPCTDAWKRLWMRSWNSTNETQQEQTNRLEVEYFVWYFGRTSNGSRLWRGFRYGCRGSAEGHTNVCKFSKLVLFPVVSTDFKKPWKILLFKLILSTEASGIRQIKENLLRCSD